MATIQDIFDWLNQGAQGDIPGTGGSQPNPPTVSAPAPPQPGTSQPTSQPSPQEQPPPGQAQPGAQDAGEKGRQAGQKAGQGLWAMLFGKQPQKTPGDYSGDISPSLLGHYNALIQSGLPPAVAHSILTQPSVGEGDTSLDQIFHTWPYAYQGEAQDKQAEASDFPPEPPIGEQMWRARGAQQQNAPVAEGQTPSVTDTLGYQRLPTGQYVPYPSPYSLDYYMQQGDPTSFWWNPQPGSSWAPSGGQ